MNETNEMWREVKKHSQDKRERNRNNGAKALRERDILFETRNSGAHLIVYHNGLRVDYWPGTGYWIVKDGGRKGRGIRRLLGLREGVTA